MIGIIAGIITLIVPFAAVLTILNRKTKRREDCLRQFRSDGSIRQTPEQCQKHIIDVPLFRRVHRGPCYSTRPCGYTGWAECFGDGVNRCGDCPANLANYSEEEIEEAMNVDISEWFASSTAVITDEDYSDMWCEEDSGELRIRYEVYADVAKQDKAPDS